MRAALLSVLCFLTLSGGSSVVAADYHSQLAATSFDQKNYKLALSEAERILKVDPKSTYALEIATKSSKNLGRYKDGASYAEKLYSIDKSVNSLFLQAYCLYLAERFSDSLKVSDRIIAKDPTYGPAYLLKAEIIRMRDGVSKRYIELVKGAEASGFQSKSFGEDLADAKLTIDRARKKKD